MQTIEYQTSLGPQSQQSIIIAAINNAIPPPAQLGATLSYSAGFASFVLVVYQEPDELSRIEVRYNPNWLNDEAGAALASELTASLLLALFQSRQESAVTVVEVSVNEGGGTEIVLTSR